MDATKPLWRSVLEDLQRRLDAGEFATRFPTDRELMETYEVSRHTVREAVRRLQSDGIVTRHPGRGSYVDAGVFHQPVGTVYSLFENIESTGAIQNSLVLRQEIVTDTHAAAVLELDEDAGLFYLERIRLANGEALAHDRTWLPQSCAGALVDTDFTHTALYTELERACGLRPESGRELIKPVIPGPAYAGYLHVAADQPVFEIERRTRANGAPLEWRITLIRGDRYVFSAVWDTSDRDLVPRMMAS